MTAEAYLGVWELIPELCIYEQGQAPGSGRYEITQAGDGMVAISILWRDRSGEHHRIEFGGRTDGSPQRTGAPGLTHMTLTRVDSRTLDSAAYDGDVCRTYARRVAHGDLLATWQKINAGGGSHSIFQVYRRLPG